MKSSTKKFWKKHKKKILIGTAIVAVITVAVVVVVCSGGGAAPVIPAAAGGALTGSDRKKKKQDPKEPPSTEGGSPDPLPSETQNTPDKIESPFEQMLLESTFSRKIEFKEDGVTINNEHFTYLQMLQKANTDVFLSSFDPDKKAPCFEPSVFPKTRYLLFMKVNSPLPHQSHQMVFGLKILLKYLKKKTCLSEVFSCNYMGYSPNTAQLLQENWTNFHMENMNEVMLIYSTNFYNG